MTWNMYDLIKYIQQYGCEVDEDNNGQIIIYTNLMDDNGTLTVMPEEGE